jgi:hypothetical protein
MEKCCCEIRRREMKKSAGRKERRKEARRLRRAEGKEKAKLNEMRQKWEAKNLR